MGPFTRENLKRPLEGWIRGSEVSQRLVKPPSASWGPPPKKPHQLSVENKTGERVGLWIRSRSLDRDEWTTRFYVLAPRFGRQFDMPGSAHRVYVRAEAVSRVWLPGGDEVSIEYEGLALKLRALELNLSAASTEWRLDDL